MGVALVGVATGKVSNRVTLLSGTTYTVPAGVTSLNVSLFGGGGGGTNTSTTSSAQSGGFHVAGVAGMAGQVVHSVISTNPGATIAYAIGAGGSTASTGGSTTMTGATTAAGGLGGGSTGTQAAGQFNGGSGAAGTSSSVAGTGATGGAGCIVVEYWA